MEKNALTLYTKGVEKIENEKICRTLNSDIANRAMDYGRAYAYNILR